MKKLTCIKPYRVIDIKDWWTELKVEFFEDEIVISDAEGSISISPEHIRQLPFYINE